MRNLRKKIATVTKEEAIRDLTNAFLEDGYKNINSLVDDWFIDARNGVFNEFSSFEEFFEKSKNEQNKIIENWIFGSTYNQHDYSYFNEVLDEIIENKNLSDKEKKIYYDVYYDAAKKSSSDKQFLETFRKKIDKYKNQNNWNTENTINPDFNKGMNKINCIRVRLQKKLS